MNIKKYKQILLNDLYANYKNCHACPLGSLGRINTVFGEGNPNALLMLIGEAPGKNEDIQKKPFIGRSGQLLTKALNLVNIDRQDIYITNVVKCRPPANRLPLPSESNICKKILLFKQIKIIQPQVICTLGSCAIQAILEQPVKITKTRGIPIKKNGITFLPTYHPAYILRNPKELKTFIKDLDLASKLTKQL